MSRVALTRVNWICVGVNFMLTMNAIADGSAGRTAFSIFAGVFCACAALYSEPEVAA
jgi:hypothetical protein